MELLGRISTTGKSLARFSFDGFPPTKLHHPIPTQIECQGEAILGLRCQTRLEHRTCLKPPQLPEAHQQTEGFRTIARQYSLVPNLKPKPGRLPCPLLQGRRRRQQDTAVSSNGSIALSNLTFGQHSPPQVADDSLDPQPRASH